MQAALRCVRIFARTVLTRCRAACFVLLALWPFAHGVRAQQPDAAAAIGGIDASVQSRYAHVLSFTDIEHYAVYRGSDLNHPVAEMTVKDTYRKGVGKTYDILSQSGSGTVIRFGLNPLLENEKAINQPVNLPTSWFTSANYEMRPALNQTERIDGHDCLVIDVTAKRKATNALNGRIWVDAKDYSLVQIDGIATRSPSMFARAAHMMRQYVEIDGFSMAAHARAESDSFLLGRFVVTIDYSGYHLQLNPAK